MIVEQILRAKPSGEVHTIGTGATLAEAIQLLTKERIGAAIVSDREGGFSGILSERDIVKRLDAEGAGALDQKVGDVMTTEVVVCRPEETANSVLERMTEGRFRHMPVCQGDRLVGVLSIGDVVKARLDDVTRENAAMAEMLGH